MIIFSQLGRYGRFANGLYQIASIMGIAVKSGQPYGFPTWFNYDHRDRFGAKEDINLHEHLVNPLPSFPPVHYEQKFIHWGYHDITLTNGNWDLLGHFQSPRYFKHCIELVREQLTFKNEPPLNDYCAVHFRAGDYIDDSNAYHPRCTIEYYKEAIARIPATRFMIFSDDLEAARKVFEGHNVEYSTSRDYIEDYKQMKACKHFIIANSSYSSFAATMANQEGKVVVAPKKWFGPQANGLNGDDIYDENWIVI